MRRVTALTLTLLSISAGAYAQENNEYQPYVTGPRREIEVTPFNKRLENEGFAKTLNTLGINPATPMPPQCATPVQLALEYWAGDRTLDIGVLEGELPDWEYHEAKKLTYVDFVNDQDGLHHVRHWQLNYYRLRDSCIHDIQDEADAKAEAAKIIHTAPVPKQ